MTNMAKNPQDYGLQNVDLDTPVEYDSLQLTAATNLNLIADATLQPVSVIRDLNPSLLRTVVPAGFQVHVPKGSADSTQAALESVPAGSREAWRLHHVASGDTLSEIARTYHVSPDRLADVNGSADSLEVGDVLLIPAAYHEPPSATRKLRGSKAALVSGSFRSSKSTSMRQSTHLAAAHRLPSQVLHRKAAVRTASIAQ
jgi:membrane-bound lytic murein transglycosylase D